MEDKDYSILKNLNGKQKRRFANCYLIQKKDTNEQFVLKTAHANTLPHLRKEATFSFENLHLPKVIAFKATENEGELILKFKEGLQIQTYYNTLKRKNRIPFLIKLTEQITELLIILNKGNIVHLDIKPSNIIYTPSTEIFHIIDFGLAEHLPAPQLKILFPLGYASPEQLLAYSDCFSLGTDLFALGATLYHLYTGQIPLTHTNPSIFTNLQLAHPIERPSGMPKPLFKIIEGFMTKPKWKTAPNRMHTEEVRNVLLESIKKREESLLSLSQNLELLKKHNSTNLFIKLFSKSNI